MAWNGAPAPDSDSSSFVITGTSIRVQTGAVTMDHDSAVTDTAAVSFPDEFSSAPKVSLTVVGRAADYVASTTGGPSTTGFTVETRYILNTAATATFLVHWMAIGPA